jgi:hypothetical protein
VFPLAAFLTCRAGENQPHALRHTQSCCAVPAGVVEHEQDGAVDAGLRFTRKGFYQRRKKNGFETPSCTYQKVSPVAGETKLVT